MAEEHAGTGFLVSWANAECTLPLELAVGTLNTTPSSQRARRVNDGILVITCSGLLF